MTYSRKFGFVMTERLWQALILILAAGVLFITFWCLMHGITTIFMHLYYFPIVLLAYHYRWKGCWIATVLALAYVGLVVLFEPETPDVVLGALYRFLVFVGIAAIIAYLSEQLVRAERAGQESTQVKEQYISLAPAIILVLDHNGTITYLNDKGCRILECTADGIVGKDWVNTFINKEDREPVRSLFAGIMRGDLEPHRMVEGNVITGTGATRYIRWYNTLLKGRDGTITGVLSYGEDITEEKAAQDSLKTLQQFQESVITNANVWISVLAPDGTILVWNDAAEQISGYKKADVLGKNAVWKELYPAPEYRKRVTKEIQRALSSETRLEDFETVIRCADTTTRTIVWNTRGLRDNRGIITSFIAIGRDVTGQREAELRAGESSRFLGTMIDTLPVPVFFKDTNGKYLGCNPPFSEYLGITREEIVGKSVYDLSPADLADKYAAADRQLFDNPVPQRYETQVQYADGSLHDVIFYKAPFFQNDGTPGGLIGTFLDITDRKRAEERILLLLNSTAESIYGIDMDGNCTFCNKACLTSLGYQDEHDLLGKNMHWQIHGKHADGSRFPVEECRIFRAFRKGEGTHVDDEVLWRADGSSFPAEYWSYPQQEEGVVVGAVVTFLDITDRLLAQNALKESEAKYRTLFENMLEGFAYCRMIYDEQGLPVDWVYLSVNASFERMTGLANIEGKRVLEAIPDIKALTPEIFAMYGRVATTGTPETFEIDFKPLKSWLKVSAFCPQKGYFVAVFDDITESRTSQERISALLKEKEEQLRIINTSPAVAFLWKAEEHWPVEAVSANITQFGYTPEDFLSGTVPFSSLIHPDDLDRVGAEVESNSSNHIDDFMQEYRIFGKNHDLFWILDYTHIRRDPSGTITHYEGIVLDITDRKLAEQALQESEHRSAMLLKAIPDMMFIISREGVYRDVRVPDDTALALPADRIIGTNIRDSGFGEESTDTILYHLGMALDTNKLQLFEYELFLPQGLRQYEARMVALSNQEVLGIIRDITGRKEMETALILSQQTYRSYVDNSPVGIFVAESSGKYLDVNDAALRLLGYSREEMISMTVLDLALFEERQQTLDLFTSIQERLKSEPSVSVELRLRKKDGSGCPVILSTVRLPNDTILGFTLDISERKAAEDALRESQQLFSDIISFLPDPTFVIDREGIVVAWNRALEQISGVPAADIIGKGDHEYSLWLYDKRRPILIDLVLHPDLDAGRMNYTGIQKEGHTITAQTGIRSKKGDRPVTLSLVASPLFDSQGTITGAIESMRDISRLKEAEADLARINQNLEQMVKDRTRALQEEVAQRMEAEKEVQASLDYTRSVIEANPDLMVVLDSNGTILDVNTAGEILTGIKKDQLIGTTYFGYLVEDGTVRSAFAGLLEKGRIENLVHIQRIDGHITPLSVHATVIRSQNDRNDRIIVAAHDITRQKQDEDAIRASLEEKVVLLREIHHRVKNNLQIIISLTNLQMRQTDDPTIKQIISETQNRVRAMSLVHEKLYRSTSLSRIDFSDYTRFLATQLFSYFGTDTRRVKLDFAMGEIMVDINTAVPLGLLMNELVSNALKHAFPDGKEGTIGISGTQEGDRITLIVRDDGIGMPPDLDWTNTASLGMRLVTSLVDQVNGTITLDAGSGTAWTITVQKGPAGNREAGE